MIRSYFLLLFVLLCGYSNVDGQAFTTFGLGDPYGNGLIQNQGMGGIGVSQPQFWYLNNQNPALLVYNVVTVFQAGAMGESRRTSVDSLTERNVSGNLNYLVTAFPVKVNRWTTSLGLMPYTIVNYDLTYTAPFVGEGGQVEKDVPVIETGSGGLSQFYWANGVRLTRELTVGLRAAYLFGPIETKYANRVVEAGQTNPFIFQLKERTVIRDFLFTAGLSFSKDSLGRRKAYRFSAGATGSLKTKLNAEAWVERSRLDLNENAVEPADTLLTEDGSVFLPGTFTVGFSWARGNFWNVGTEFSYQNWTSFRSINADDEGLGKSWRAAIGGEITPDALAGDNYLKRITYRVGLSYEKYPFIVNSNPVSDFGINFGFSLPAGRSSLDLAFKVGKRGDKEENLLEESYFKVYFGITFNDQWFIRRKFD